jgi:nucleoside-diphosphate-sugar epimerase
MINGDGLEKRDYVYIDDAVAATLLALMKKPECVLNIGSGQSHTTRHIAEEVIRLCSVNKEPIFTPRPEPNIDLTCDISAARKILGYQPQTTLEQGLRQEIEWYRKEAKAEPRP